MSDNIPLEIQKEIIQRIPDIKSVIQYRSVSKAWKSMIDSTEFVAGHTLRNTHHQAHRHLLVRKQDRGAQVKYVSIVDNDNFPDQKLSVFVPEKTVAIAVPNVLREVYYRTVVGFGVCPSILDPKLVKITYVCYLTKLQDANTSTQVEVFTLSSGWTWKSPSSSNVPRKSIGFGCSQAVIDGFIYWDAVDRINVDDGFRKHNLIMSFDLTSEEFTEVNLPDSLALNLNADLSVSNLRGSLAVLEFNKYTLREICNVWMMIGRSFNKLYSINAPEASISTTLGFRKSGAPIIEVENYNEEYYHLLFMNQNQKASLTSEFMD